MNSCMDMSCLKRCQLKSAFLLTLVAMSCASTMVRRAADQAPPAPCFLLDTAGALMKPDLLNVTEDLLRRATGAKRLTQDIKTFITTHHLTSNILTRHSETHSFISAPESTITEQSRLAAISNPGQAMREHYSLLFNLVVHVEHVRTNGILSKDVGDKAVKVKFLELERKIFDLLCDLKIALTSIDHDTSTIQTAFTVSELFKEAASSRGNETMRAYVVVKDCGIIMEYLVEIYSAIYTQLLINAVTTA